MATTLQAYNNDPQLKADFLAKIRKHQDADRIIQGRYGENNEDFRGCAVGCSIRSLNIIKGKNIPTNSHAAYEPELGMPEWLARLEDAIFEGLPVEDSKWWPLRFASAVPVGAYLEPVKWKFTAYLMASNIERVLALDVPDSLRTEVVDAIRGVLKVAETAVTTGEWDQSAAESAARSAAESAAWSAESAARSAAESAAWSAAESAAESAARSAAESAAESAARSAAWSAESAARSAAWSAAESAARSAAWSAAESAARSAAWSAESAARSAAESAARSAESAAWSARSAARSAAWSAESAAESAARSAEYIKHADKLVELLKGAEVVVQR